MKFWVGVTDNKWYKYLSELRPEEVNFWQPSGTPPFTHASIGLPFLFKLKRPYNHIAGGGFFVTYSTLSLSLAWDVFGNKNGCNSFCEFKNLVNPLKSRSKKSEEIGCTVLANPFFFEKGRWIENPQGWAPSIVRGKMYDTDNISGKSIWDDVQNRINKLAIAAECDRSIAAIGSDGDEKYGTGNTVYPRIGQSSFRLLVTDAYKRKCAITGESTLVALEAAHIVPYAQTGNHSVRNGMLLRADFHRLFDVGLVSVTPDLEVRVSPRIREEWFNGKNYYRLDGEKLSIIPSDPAMTPDPEFLDWHYRNQFQS